MSTQSAQTTDLTPSSYAQEVRLAVVMYGGVSLAIYINGVSQELLRMVRSTAPIGAGGGPLPAANLRGSEKVYRKLSGLLGNLAMGGDAQAGFDLKEVADEAPTRFVIDTIAGTSAGGINGVFLAKALANGQDLDELQRLWVREGAIEKLINDALSEDPPLSAAEPPTALLNGQRMYFELLKAFEGMESTSASSCDSDRSGKPLVDELDLFVTATDLRGITLPMRLADEVVFERRHKNVFRFVYSSGEEPRNDFTVKNNPFLAFAARSTSSFPFAFEPMALNDIDAVLDVHELIGGDNQQFGSNSDEWKRFFRSYPDAKGLRSVPFTRRSFADGGDLDNKPFSYVIDTLSRRHAEVPVQRKLIYIEPSPEHPEDEVELDRKPNFIENVLDALTSLPRYETIREDLQRIVDRNRIIERLNRIVYDVEGDEQRAKQSHDSGVLELSRDESELWARKVLSDSQWASLDVTDMIRRKGRAYLAYHRMEIAAVTDELATLIARVAGLDEESDYHLVIRALVRAWREKSFSAYHDPERRTLNAFLNSYDFSYSLRRISFLQRKADFLFKLDEKALTVLERRATAPWGEGGPSKAQAAEFRDELYRIKSELKRLHDALRQLGRNLRSRYRREQITSSAEATSEVAVSPLYQLVEDLITALNKQVNLEFGNSPDDKADLLKYFLAPDRPADATNDPREDKNNQGETVADRAARRAAKLLNTERTSPAGEDKEVDLWGSFKSLAEELEKQIAFKNGINEKCLEVLGKQFEPPKEKKPKRDDSSARAAARDCLRYYFENYDDFDMITFPFLFNTEIGEAAIVEVFRISPEDARILINERDESISKCRKLAGTSLGHFGAFLERRWRENDILWGRLDAAERLITALLPPDHPNKRALIGEAQAAIVLETIKDMGQEELQDLLCESAMRTNSENPEADILTNFVKQLKENAGTLNSDLLPLLQDQVIRQHYLNIYEERSRLNAQATLRTAARATTVVGKMFQDLAEQYKVSGKSFAVIARCGQIFWGLVEVSVPRTIPHLLFRYWLKLLYLLELLLIIFSTLLISPDVQKFAFLLFALTVSIHSAVWILESLITSSKAWLSILKALAITICAVLLIAGALGLAGTFGIDPIWQRMAGVHTWLTGQTTGKWPTRIAIVVSFTIFFLLTIRHDLASWWRSSFSPDKLIPHSFEPIAIQPLTPVARKRITKSRRFLFLPGKKVVIPFRLSAEPPKEWRQLLKKSWSNTHHAGAIRITGRELRLKCEPQNLQETFEALKVAIKTTNKTMTEEAQLLLKTGPKGISPRAEKTEFESRLDKLDYTV